MKHIKYFESVDSDSYLRDYGLTPEDISYFLTDLSDDGWIVRSRFNKKLHQFEIDEPIKPGDIKLGLIPSIEIIITKNWPRFEFSKYMANKLFNELINSENYLEIMDVFSNRLSEVGLYIQKQYISGFELHILIYRKTDKNYIK
jgi:hypothetical protein